MAQLPTTQPSDLDEILRDKMGEIMALIGAIEAGEADCDLKLAELLEGSTEQERVAVVEKLRELLRSRAAEKEKELDKHLEAQKRVEVVRQRNMFMQWLTWIMSEETLRKIRMAFLVRPALEGHVKNIGQELANFGVQAQLADKRELGGISANVSPAQGVGQEKGKGDKGRE